MFAPSISRGTRTRGAASFVAVAALIVAPVLASPALGQPDPGDPDAPRFKGAPDAAAPAAPAGPECDLNSGDHAKDEFAHCTDVVVDFATTPDVGETTTVEVSVTSVADRTGTLTVLVNDRFDIADAVGFDDAGTEPSGVGELTGVSRSISVSADTTQTFTIDVAGEKGGIGIVQARFDTAGNVYNGRDEATAQLGQAAPIPELGRPTVQVPADAELAPAAPSPAPAATPPTPWKKPATQLAPGAPNASCATGGWRFNDENGVNQPSQYFRVQIWDQDDGGDDLLAQDYTNGSGNYNICFESTDGEGGGQEVYVRFVSNAVAWRVRNTAASDTDYAYVSGVFNYADPGGTHSFGNLQPASAAEHRALHAYDGIARLWLWHFSIHNYLDNPGESRPVIVNWTPTSTDGTYYSLGGNDIHLAAADPDADHTTIHEGSHALMDAIYNDDFPPAPNCNPHSIFGPSSTGCAWTEGWAEWVPARVLDDPFYRWPDGNSLDLETPSWHNFTGAYGDTAEGRIAGSLIDLSDSANEDYWDRFTEGGGSASSEEIYATNLTGVSDTLAEFFLIDRPGEGDTGFFARAALFQNTIDYTHRDPLVSQQELLRPSLALAPNPHNYSYTASSQFWGGVAIRPGGDYDLLLYDDQAQTALLKSSGFGGTAIDYIVIDGNHRTGTFFPRATLFSGSGNYRIEEFTGNDALGLGSEGESFSSTDVIKPFDTSVNAGQTNYVRVVPSGGLDVELFAHDSDGTSDGAVQSRAQAQDSSDVGGAGVAESVTYSSPAADWAGIVVLKQAGSGSYTIYRDTSGPGSPTVLIDNGNTNTYDTTVDLDLSATAANGAGSTPLVDMQISTDGVFDSEAWVPYATSATATLPGGLGTKTVTVRYRNAAGATSMASDTIELATAPNCAGQAPTIFGSGTINGTAGPDVIVGSENNDIIFAKGGDDVICGLDGNDRVYDGPGADTVHGGGDDDKIFQSSAADAGDVIFGNAGVDEVRYNGRTAPLSISLNGLANDGAAGEGDFVSTTVEDVTGGQNDDNITGSASANLIRGIGGNDVINGGGGDDTLRGHAGDDVVNGGGGNDNVNGGNGSDTVRGDAGDDHVDGANGDDLIDEGTAANGADNLIGGTGVDTIRYTSRAANVSILLNGVPTSGAAGESDRTVGFEIALGGSGDDTIAGHIRNESLYGNAGNDTISGNNGHDTVVGGTGNDDLFGNAHNDTLNSKDNVNGNDSINGGAGADTATSDPSDSVTGVP